MSVSLFEKQPANTPLANVLARAGEIILGKDRQIKMAMCCILARGHLLIEDVPGVGKTTLSHVLASLLGLQYQRIQFTSDLLPADVVGVSIFDRESSTFRFHPGPIFSQVILADEINRASPKAQSALLEAMEEHQVTADGETMKLPEPFFVIATQNPSHQIGTFPLPESQLDRFLMRIKLGYPGQSRGARTAQRRRPPRPDRTHHDRDVGRGTDLAAKGGGKSICFGSAGRLRAGAGAAYARLGAL